MFEEILGYAATYSYFTDQSIKSMLKPFQDEEEEKIKQHKCFAKKDGIDETAIRHRIDLTNAGLLEDVIEGYEPEVFEFFLHGNGFILPLQGTKYVANKIEKKVCYYISGPLFVECEKDSAEISVFKYRQAIFKLAGYPGDGVIVGITKKSKKPEPDSPESNKPKPDSPEPSNPEDKPKYCSEFAKLVYSADLDSILIQMQKNVGSQEKPIFKPEGEPRFTFSLVSKPNQK
ncbi:MAG: hypothetical protein PHC66_04205 [Candidatus Nanoarchaeia archaeon]|nr:hypothetical protein [Candidatus Nanoarchaeia archaeon]MDD5238873.1 hypothetical protein [Candidatus Nanoarchaeia archaeon]